MPTNTATRPLESLVLRGSVIVAGCAGSAAQGLWWTSLPPTERPIVGCDCKDSFCSRVLYRSADMKKTSSAAVAQHIAAGDGNRTSKARPIFRRQQSRLSGQSPPFVRQDLEKIYSNTDVSRHQARMNLGKRRRRTPTIAWPDQWDVLTARLCLRSPSRACINRRRDGRPCTPPGARRRTHR